MKNSEIKEKLKKEVSGIKAPDVLADVKNADLSRYKDRDAGEIIIKNPSFRRRRLLVSFASAFVLVVLLLSVTLFPSLNVNKSAYASVSLDINPSVEIVLNKDDVVIDIKAINNDGKQIMQGRFKNRNIEIVMEKLVRNSKKYSYLSEGENGENVLLLCINSNTQADSAKIQEKIEKAIDGACKGNGVNAKKMFSAYKAELKEKAELYGVSVGKLEMILRAYAHNADGMAETEFVEHVKEWSVKKLSDYIAA